jgi:hypothetical protein
MIQPRAKFEPEDDLDQFGDDIMQQLENEANEEEEDSSYVSEYNEVISKISHLCSQISSGKSTVDEHLALKLCPRIWALAYKY